MHCELTTSNRVAIESEARALANERVMVATNQGTYGPVEACRKIGTGDPAAANCDIFERVGDRQLTDAALEERFNGIGRLRVFRAAVTAKRARLAELRRRIQDAR